MHSPLAPAARHRRHTDVTTLPIRNVPMQLMVEGHGDGCSCHPIGEWDDEPTQTEAAPLSHRRLCSCGGETITFTCDCGSSSCGCCDGTGTGHAIVTKLSVTIGMPGRGGVTFDRGIESEERIAEALEIVDSCCRPHLEQLLRSDGDDEPQPHHIVAALSVDVAPAMPAAAPMSIMDVLVEMTKVAVLDANAHARDVSRALAQLGRERVLIPVLRGAL